jgi:hypothetical protein
MPIACAEKIVAATREEFHRIDEILLGVSYDVHNEFGRFLDEKVYQREIAWRCGRIGLT